MQFIRYIDITIISPAQALLLGGATICILWYFKYIFCIIYVVAIKFIIIIKYKIQLIISYKT